MAGTVKLGVDFDLAPFRREVDAFLKKQIPFARALAVTRVALKARDQLRADAPKQFNLRNKRLISGIRSTRATKSNPEAAVGSLDGWMVLQTKGGDKTGGMGSEGGRNKGPRGAGRRVAIPIRARKGKMAVTRPSSWPGRLIDKKRTFSEKGSGGAILLYQIMGSKKDPKLRLMWTLQKSVPVRPRWPLERTVETVLRREWKRTAVQALKDATKTGRR